MDPAIPNAMEIKASAETCLRILLYAARKKEPSAFADTLANLLHDGSMSDFKITKLATALSEEHRALDSEHFNTLATIAAARRWRRLSTFARDNGANARAHALGLLVRNVHARNVKGVKLALARDADPLSREASLLPEVAAGNGDCEILAELISAGVPIGGEAGSAALRAAVFCGSCSVIKLLRSAGVDWRSVEAARFIRAAHGGDTDSLEIIYALSIEGIESRTVNEALCAAVAANAASATADLLDKYGADVDAFDCAPMLAAVRANSFDSALVLLQRDAILQPAKADMVDLLAIAHSRPRISELVRSVRNLPSRNGDLEQKMVDFFCQVIDLREVVGFRSKPRALAAEQELLPTT